MDTHNRQPKGQSDGGQFAPKTNAEATVVLPRMPQQNEGIITTVRVLGGKSKTHLIDQSVDDRATLCGRSMDEGSLYNSDVTVGQCAKVAAVANDEFCAGCTKSLAASVSPDPDDIEYFAPWAVDQSNVAEAFENAAALVDRYGRGNGDASDLAQVGEIVGYSVERNLVGDDLREWLDELVTRADYLESESERLTPDMTRQISESVAADLREVAGRARG